MTDDGTVFTFMSGSGKVFSVVASKCNIVGTPPNEWYEIMDSTDDQALNKSAMRPISCLSHFTPTQIFVHTNIIPIITSSLSFEMSFEQQ